MNSIVSVKVGQTEIRVEGEQDWVSETYKQILIDIENIKSIPMVVSPPSKATESSTDNFPALPIFLRDRDALKSQNLKFLATAIWLQGQGKNRLTTSDVSAALSRFNQGRFGNVSDVLNQNVSKGFCVKDGKEFYVTPEGKQEIGLES